MPYVIIMGTEIPEKYLEEVARIGEIYAEIRRWSGLLGNFGPTIFYRDMAKRDVEQLKETIEFYNQGVPEGIKERFYVAPIYVRSLNLECDRILKRFEKVEKQLEDKVEPKALVGQTLRGLNIMVKQTKRRKPQKRAEKYIRCIPCPFG